MSDWRDLNISKKELQDLEKSEERETDAQVRSLRLRNLGKRATTSRRNSVVMFEVPEDFDLSFKDKGACKGVDRELFIPEGRGESSVTIEQAKLVCAECIVSMECLEFALLPGNDAQGVWGGTSENERVTIKRNRKRNVA
jgi:WhiB family redox-sensing transcriptional regulator